MGAFLLGKQGGAGSIPASLTNQTEVHMGAFSVRNRGEAGSIPARLTNRRTREA